jgi:hypothetical protein
MYGKICLENIKFKQSTTFYRSIANPDQPEQAPIATIQIAKHSLLACVCSVTLFWIFIDKFEPLQKNQPANLVVP